MTFHLDYPDLVFKPCLASFDYDQTYDLVHLQPTIFDFQEESKDFNFIALLCSGNPILIDRFTARRHNNFDYYYSYKVFSAFSKYSNTFDVRSSYYSQYEMENFASPHYLIMSFSPWALFNGAKEIKLLLSLPVNCANMVLTYLELDKTGACYTANLVTVVKQTKKEITDFFQEFLLNFESFVPCSFSLFFNNVNHNNLLPNSLSQDNLDSYLSYLVNQMDGYDWDSLIYFDNCVYTGRCILRTDHLRYGVASANHWLFYNEQYALELTAQTNYGIIPSWQKKALFLKGNNNLWGQPPHPSEDLFDTYPSVYWSSSVFSLNDYELEEVLYSWYRELNPDEFTPDLPEDDPPYLDNGGGELDWAGSPNPFYKAYYNNSLCYYDVSLSGIGTYDLYPNYEMTQEYSYFNSFQCSYYDFYKKKLNSAYVYLLTITTHDLGDPNIYGDNTVLNEFDFRLREYSFDESTGTLTSVQLAQETWDNTVFVESGDDYDDSDRLLNIYDQRVLTLPFGTSQYEIRTVEPPENWLGYSQSETLSYYSIGQVADFLYQRIRKSTVMGDSARVKETYELTRQIWACLGAGEFNFDDSGEIPYFMHLSRRIRSICLALGLLFHEDGKVMSARQSQVVSQGDEIPSGWSIGQFSRNKGGNKHPNAQQGGSPEEERIGVAYEIKSNKFTKDPASGKKALGKSGYVLVECLPQLLHIQNQDLDKALGLQELGAYVLENPNYQEESTDKEKAPPYFEFEGLGDLVKNLAYAIAEISRQVSQANLGTLKNQAILTELFFALGVPCLEKYLTLEISGQNVTVPYPAFNSEAMNLTDLQFLQLENIALLNQGTIEINYKSN